MGSHLMPTRDGHRVGPPQPTPWMEEAACKGMPTVVFYPPKGSPAGEAKAICARCPVRLPCLEYALENHERDGVFGGKTYKDRLRIQKYRQLGLD